jgi:hypothetical protein
MPEERPMVRIPLRWVRLGMVVVLVLVVVPGAALAAGSFDDDDNSMFEADIEWLAQTGITQGCSVSPPLFCPDRAVTRGQMAAFLHRFYQYLDSQGAAAQPMAFHEGGEKMQGFLGTAPMRVQRLQFIPPAAGTVVVNWAAIVSGEGYVQCSPTTGATIDPDAAFGKAGEAELIAGSRTFDVAGGSTFTVNLMCETQTGISDPYWQVDNPQITATYLPGA